MNALNRVTYYNLPKSFRKKYVNLDSKTSFNFLLATYDIDNKIYEKLTGTF